VVSVPNSTPDEQGTLGIQPLGGRGWSPVEQDHDNARDVERSHRRVDEEVGVVEGAEGRRLGAALGVVPDNITFLFLLVPLHTNWVIISKMLFPANLLASTGLIIAIVQKAKFARRRDRSRKDQNKDSNFIETLSKYSW